MALATRTASNALKQLLQAAAGLPDAAHNDLRVQAFTDSGTPLVRWHLALADDDIDNPDTELGGGGYELGVGVTLVFAVEGEPELDGNPRDVVFDAGVEAIRDVLWPLPDRLPLSVLGAFDSLEIDGVAERLHIAEPGATPIEALRIKLNLLTTAPTPIG